MDEHDFRNSQPPSDRQAMTEVVEGLMARRVEFQDRARTWARSPSFREVYESHHPGMAVKVIGTLIGKGAHIRARSGALWNEYLRLAAEGELVLAATVIGNAHISEAPLMPLPAAVLVPLAQDAQGVMQAAVFADQLVDAYLLGEGGAIPLCAKLMADDEYRPFRRRSLPVQETGGVTLSLHDVKLRGIDVWGAPILSLVPLLLDRNGRLFLAVPWHVILDVPAPSESLPPRHTISKATPPPLPGRPLETSPGGSTILRHSPQDTSFTPASSDGKTASLVEAHVNRHLGQVQTVFHELISDKVHLDVHFIPPTAERPFHTLVTSGMSDQPMTVPAGAEEFRHAELLICLPAAWKLRSEENGEDPFRDERHYWPIRWLKRLARLPHEHRTWIGPLHTIPNGDPAMPLAPDVPFTGFIVGPAFTVPDEFHLLDAGPGKSIRFYAIYPLTSAEMDFKLEHGGETLLAALAKHGVNEIVNVERPSVA